MNITFCCHLFSLKAVLQGMSKNNSTKKQINPGIKVTKKHAPARKFNEKKMFKDYRNKLQRQFTKLQFLPSECVFLNFCYMGYVLLLIF